MKKALLLVLVPAVTLWAPARQVHAFSDDRVPVPIPSGWQGGHPPLPLVSVAPPGSSSPSHYEAARDEAARVVAQSAPSLYDTLQQAPAPAWRSSQRWGGGDDSTRQPPVDGGGTPAKQYRFRGDKPPAAGDPEVGGDHRFRPLTAQERQRHQPASAWRPLIEAPQGAAPGPLPGHGPPPGFFGPPGGGPWGGPGPANPWEPPDNSGRPGIETENWFDRYYGAGRR